MKKLGFGCMRMPVKKGLGDGYINYFRAGEMMDYYLERGYDYFDTAYMYHKGNSERAVGKLLSQRKDRNSFLLADKMPVGMIKQKSSCKRIFSNQLKKCATDHFDYYLLHCLNKENYEKAIKYKVFEELEEKKKKGQIVRLGFSFHDTADVLDKILSEHPEMEFVQLQINYLDWNDKNVQSKLCYETARRHGKDIIVMEPVKGGKLAQVSSDIQKEIDLVRPGLSPACFALGFAASLEGVITVLSGMSDMNQLKENLDFFDTLLPFSPAELEAAVKIGEKIRDEKEIPCTDCKYCVKGCPQKINIPEYFKSFNLKAKDKKEALSLYRSTEKTSAPIDSCIACGRCESACPQKINIINRLKKVEESFR